ncbi:MAG: response regulator, partial [Planctomycetota bacterium]
MASAGERCRILLVDDEPVVVGLLSRVLEKHDGVFELEVAHGAQQAIERLEAARFDAVVTDLDMP